MKTLIHTNIQPAKEHYRTKEEKAHIRLYKRKTKQQHLIHLCNRYGLATSIVLILFFMLMKHFHLHELLGLRYFNLIFLSIAILTSLMQYKKNKQGGKLDYNACIKMGIRTSSMSIAPFSIFMGIYLMKNPSFMNFIQRNFNLGDFFNPAIMTITLFVEGISYGVLLTILFVCILSKRRK